MRSQLKGPRTLAFLLRVGSAALLLSPCVASASEWIAVPLDNESQFLNIQVRHVMKPAEIGEVVSTATVRFVENTDSGSKLTYTDIDCVAMRHKPISYTLYSRPFLRGAISEFVLVDGWDWFDIADDGDLVKPISEIACNKNGTSVHMIGRAIYVESWEDRDVFEQRMGQEWVPLVTDENDTLAAISFTELGIENNEVKVWVLTTFAEVRTLTRDVKYQSSISRWTIDCSSRNMVAEQMTFYSGPRAGGTAVHTRAEKTDLGIAPPGTGNFMFVTALCGR